MLLTVGPSPTSNPGFSANAPFLLWDPTESASLALESNRQRPEEVVGAMGAGIVAVVSSLVWVLDTSLGIPAEQWAPFSAKLFSPAQ